jgi:hypothetical protein
LVVGENIFIGGGIEGEAQKFMINWNVAFKCEGQKLLTG